VTAQKILSPLITPAELAAGLSVRPSTTRAWVLNRKIDFYRIAGTVRFDRGLLVPDWPGPRLADYWVPKDDVAALLHISRRTLELWLRQGLLPVAARYGHTVRVNQKQLFELLRRDFFFPALA
jgi:hypothetical protein